MADNALLAWSLCFSLPVGPGRDVPIYLNQISEDMKIGSRKWSTFLSQHPFEIEGGSKSVSSYPLEAMY
eukprot:scaffold293432_cov59-Attheya_sp.AAC.2